MYEKSGVHANHPTPLIKQIITIVIQNHILAAISSSYAE